MIRYTLLITIATLIAALAWVTKQRDAISELTHQNAQLRQRLDVNHTHTRSNTKRTTYQTALDAKQIDWLQVLKEIRSNDGYGYLKTTRRLDEGFRSMSYDELLSALEGIETSEMSNLDRQLLEQIICSELFTRYPERSLAQFIHRYREDIWQFSIAQGFANWVKKNPEEAITWYERQLNSGTFDSDKPDKQLKIPQRLLEYGIYSILASSPDQAGRLLVSVPQDKQLSVLSSLHLGNLSADEQIGWARLARTYLSEKDHLKAISWPTQLWSDGDGAPMKISEVSKYLDRIHPTNDELQACIMTVAGQPATWLKDWRNSKPTADDIDSLRAWVNGRMPDLVDSATAKALPRLRIPYPELESITSRYHDISHNDELLIPLLEHKEALNHKELARSIALKLSDENQRNQYLEKFK